MQGIFSGLTQHVVLCGLHASSFTDEGEYLSSHVSFAAKTRRNRGPANISSQSHWATPSTSYRQALSVTGATTISHER